MGGRQSIRGYQVQTLICVLDSLDVKNNWLSVTLEPVADSEKVDIAWMYEDRRRVVQVKSSQNQICLPDAKKWANELETATQATEYELRLLGPCSEEVAKLEEIGKVQFAKPEPENVPALLDRAAHKLDLYFHTKQISLPPTVREIVVGALTNRLLTDAIQGRTWEKAAIDDLLVKWAEVILRTTTQHLEIPLPEPRNAFFCGRDDLLTRIHDDFKQADHQGRFGIQVLSGLGGVGKTQVALEFAYRYRSDYSNVFFVDADSLSSLSVTFANVAKLLGLPASNCGTSSAYQTY